MGENFLCGQLKEVNIKHIFKRIKMEPIAVQSNSKFAHTFIMVIIYYFREVLEKDIKIEQIKYKYSRYFTDEYIIKELINQTNNTRQNYIKNLSKELELFFGNEKIERCFDIDEKFLQEIIKAK